MKPPLGQDRKLTQKLQAKKLAQELGWPRAQELEQPWEQLYLLSQGRWLEEPQE